MRIYPFKTVESGAQVNSSIIWESRGTSQLFSKEGVVGLINVDITAERALKMAMAYGTSLPKGARVSTSRDAHPASRVIKRALMCGLNSTGVVVRDLRIASSAVNRFEVKSGNSDGGMHVRIAPWDPESMQIQVFEPPGVNIADKRQKDIEKYYGRQDFRRAFYSEFGEIHFPDRAMEGYLRALDALVGPEAHPLARLPHGRRLLVLAGRLLAAQHPRPLGAEVLALRAFTEPDRPTMGPEELSANIAEVGRVVGVMEADLGFVVGPAAERLYLVDDRGLEVPAEKVLLLFVRLVAQQAPSGSRIALPLTVTRLAERLATPFGVEVVRTPVSLPALARASTEDGVVFAGGLGGGYIFPEFLPAFDAVMSLGKLLELLAPQDRRLSAVLAEIPDQHARAPHRELPLVAQGDGDAGDHRGAGAAGRGWGGGRQPEPRGRHPGEPRRGLDAVAPRRRRAALPHLRRGRRPPRLGAHGRRAGGHRPRADRRGRRVGERAAARIAAAALRRTAACATRPGGADARARTRRAHQPHALGAQHRAHA